MSGVVPQTAVRDASHASTASEPSVLTPHFEDSHTVIHCGDVRAVLAEIPADSVQTVVTSPPYWGLRDYGNEPSVWGGGMAGCPHEWGATLPAHHPGQVRDGKAVTLENAIGQNAGAGAFCRLCGAWKGCLGLEPTPEMYVEHIVEVFREVRRVLRNDGTVWLNLGDSYAGSWGAMSYPGDSIAGRRFGANGQGDVGRPVNSRNVSGLKPKDLVGIPWAVAFALRADGWWLRSDIVWSKSNPMPESVTDRPTRSHEYVFLLTKSQRYYYDAAAIREPYAASSLQRISQPTFDGQTGGEKDYQNGTNPNRSARQTLVHLKDKQRGHGRRHDGFNDRWDAMTKDEEQANGANKRTVWKIATKPYSEAHFATFPEALVTPCILAGSREGGTVLDPFSGSGTVGVVARKAGRRSVLIDVSAEYCDLAAKRIRQGVLI
jgi:DNA modification methylase